ncbi:MAG: hypothetical protein ABEI99_03355 [Halobaculum sp.]
MRLTAGVDTRDLLAALETFDGTEAERRVVARQARDLADSGRLAADRDEELTVEGVVADLSDAPDDHDLIDRWNWWIGSLETAYGGYERFSVRIVGDERDVDAE